MSKPSVIWLLTGVSEQKQFLFSLMSFYLRLAEGFFGSRFVGFFLIQLSSAHEWTSGYLAAASFHYCGIHRDVVVS